MANQLTKQVMATIVARCQGYQPMPEVESPLQPQQAVPCKSVNRKQEALLSSIIHKKENVQTEQTRAYSGGGQGQRESYSRDASQGSEPKASSVNIASLAKNGTISLDALIREIKK